jgi:hypothetical protein
VAYPFWGWGTPIKGKYFLIKAIFLVQTFLREMLKGYVMM